MQQYTLELCHRTILLIADDRVPHTCEMHTYLVRSSRRDLHLDLGFFPCTSSGVTFV